MFQARETYFSHRQPRPAQSYLPQGGRGRPPVAVQNSQDHAQRTAKHRGRFENIEFPVIPRIKVRDHQKIVENNEGVWTQLVSVEGLELLRPVCKNEIIVL